MNLSRRKDEIHENGKLISKSSLFEKLNSHVSKLLDEVKNKMNGFQSSFESSLQNIKNDNYRKCCDSMEEYLSIIQNLNRDFNDLEKKSNDLVTSICQLRVKSVFINDSMEDDKQELPSNNQQIRMNPIPSLVMDSSIHIEDIPAIKIEISDDQPEEQVETSVVSSGTQIEKQSSELVQNKLNTEKKRNSKALDETEPVFLKRCKFGPQNKSESGSVNATAPSGVSDLKIWKRVIPIKVAVPSQIKAGAAPSPKFKICFEEANGVQSLVAKKIVKDEFHPKHVTTSTN